MKFWRNIKDFILSFYYPSGKCFLVSFPKTGQTWLMFMLYKYFNKINSKINMPEKTHDCSEIILENGIRIDENYIYKYTDRYKYLRSKVIFLVRDPRDVVVSHFYQITKRSKNPYRFNSITEFIRDKKLGFKRIIHFYNLWFSNKNIPQDFLLIRYEDLLNDGVNTLEIVLKYLNVTISKDIIDQVYLESSSNKMRKLEKENRLEGFNNFGNDPNSYKVRKAKIGTFIHELSDEDIDYCNTCMKELNPFFSY